MKHIVLATGVFGVMKDPYIGYAPRQEGTFWFEVEGSRELADSIAGALNGSVHVQYAVTGIPLCNCCNAPPIDMQNGTMPNTELD